MSSGDSYEELQAEQLGITVPQLLLLRAVRKAPVVRPPARTMAVMDALTERELVELRAWGRYLITESGRAAVRRPVQIPAVFLSGPGSMRFRQRPDRRWVVDDGIPDRERGYSTARAYESETDSLEARGLTRDPAHRSRVTNHDDPNEAVYVDPDTLHWTWARGSRERHQRARGVKQLAADVRRIGPRE